MPDPDAKGTDAVAAVDQPTPAKGQAVTAPAAGQAAVRTLAASGAEAASAKAKPAKTPTHPRSGTSLPGAAVEPAGAGSEDAGAGDETKIAGAGDETKIAAALPDPAKPAASGDTDILGKAGSEAAAAKQPAPGVPDHPAKGETTAAPATVVAAPSTPPATLTSAASTLAFEGEVAGQAEAAAGVKPDAPRGAPASRVGTATDAGSTIPSSRASVQPGDADDGADIPVGSGNGTSGTPAAAPQPGRAAGAATGTGTPAESAASNTAGNKDLAIARDMPSRGSDMPAQNHAPAVNQNAAAATTFGHELKLAAHVSHSADMAAARNAPPAAANQVAVQISRAVEDGQDKLVINLKPSNLGKVSVHLEVGHDKRVIAVISAERPDSLDLLQRDARVLEHALKDAGLKTDSGSLSFSLQGDGTKESPFDNKPASNHAVAVHHDADELDTLPIRNIHAYATDASGVDIHV